MNAQPSARLTSTQKDSATEPGARQVRAEARADACFVAAPHRQPPVLQQSPQLVASQRASWAKAPAPDSPHYLLIRGKKVPVPFPTVCFDQQKNIAIDAPLPTSTWASNLLRTVWAGAQTIVSPAARKSTNFCQMLEPARIRSLWTQGNLQLCAVPRKDATGAGVDAVVLHWDGCNSSAQMFEVLRSLGLSAHLLVDSDATVYQLMDLAEMKAYHAGWINERSIGIEFNNPVDPSKVPADRACRKLVREIIPHHDGLTGTHLDFTPAQMQRCVELLDVLQEHFQVPFRLPLSIDSDGVEVTPGLVAQDFAGVCGHYHVGTHKIDPGLSFWPVIRRHWARSQAASSYERGQPNLEGSPSLAAQKQEAQRRGV